MLITAPVPFPVTNSDLADRAVDLRVLDADTINVPLGADVDVTQGTVHTVDSAPITVKNGDLLMVMASLRIGFSGTATREGEARITLLAGVGVISFLGGNSTLYAHWRKAEDNAEESRALCGLALAGADGTVTVRLEVEALASTNTFRAGMSSLHLLHLHRQTPPV